MHPQEPDVLTTVQRVPEALVLAMSRYAAATVHEAYGGRNALYNDIKPVGPKMRVCGPAVTVEARPGDNIIVHKAIYAARPGDVLVVSTMGHVESGIWGALMSLAASKRGLAGLVTDGAVRDADEIEAIGLPVFSRGLSIKGTTKSCLGRINHPLTFSGVQVHPGDLVIGDRDGVVVVRRGDVEQVREAAKQREDKEERVAGELESGRSFLELSGFGDRLAELGLTEEDPGRS